MLPSTLKYLFSVEPVRMHFPAKHPYTNDTVCNAACNIAHCITVVPLFLHAAIYLEVSLFRWTSQNAFSRETPVYKWYSVQCCMQHCTLYNSIPTFSPCCHLPWSIPFPLNQSECIFPRNSRIQMILCAMLHAALHTVSFVHGCFAGKCILTGSTE